MYYEAGFKDLAIASGHRGETLTSLGNASHFSRSQEAFYRYFLKQYFFQHCSEKLAEPETILQSIRAGLLVSDQQCKEDKSYDDFVRLALSIESENSDLYRGFTNYVNKLAKSNDTLKFWLGFVFEDGLAYVGLYLAIRGGLWDLRLACLKGMCPVFSAFDHIHYLKMLPQHFHEVLTLPVHIRKCFEQGGFVCNIKGRRMHAVALDEAHEMLVNKDIKTTIVRPTKEYLNRVLYYYPVRANAIKQLKSQLFPPDLNRGDSHPVTIFNTSPAGSGTEQNIDSIKNRIVREGGILFVPENSGLYTMSGVQATPEQQNDLLTFRDIGKQYHSAYIQYHILKDPSVNAPNRLKRLHTFSTRKRAQKKIKEKENRIVNRCIHRQLAWNAQGQSSKWEQYLELPRAICTPNGEPHKGQKSYTTKFLEKRYQARAVIVSMFPGGWIPDTVVLEGMFLINTTPLATHATMKDYVLFILRRFAFPHFVKGATQVHILFDDPGRQPHTPKAIEQSRRDAAHVVPDDHQHWEFSDSSGIPNKWREHLNCRACKRQLVVYLGHALIQSATAGALRDNQSLVIAGCFEESHRGQALSVSNSGVQCCPNLRSDVEESDSRIWLHALHSAGRKLIFSPDTDVYHIGLTLLDPQQQDVYVQLSPANSLDIRLLHLNGVLKSLEDDPDLALVPMPWPPKVLQTLFICTGCDYVSFFAGIGKATFMRHFFENASFITSTQEVPGALADTASDVMKQGFLAFLRLIGTTYFKKHLAAFTHKTPRALYLSLSCSNVTPDQQHRKWIDNIRDAIWGRVQFEDELPPSVDALWRHWQRACWVSIVWNQAACNHVALPGTTQFGWKVVGADLHFDWESDENLTTIRERVKLLFRGCSCKTGCSNRRCGCVKTGSKCGPGCNCQNCQNMPGIAPCMHVQQPALEEISEIEQEEQLLDDVVRAGYGEKFMEEEEQIPISSEEEDDDEMSADDL